ncbi:MAG: bifunctional phosphoribosyl-AMP cyclohydrolase/phosphoribosyl-ATP diphosphatase HisIE [Lachnospiraceae bacterium]|jgi:phosphoribosyl-ATP pyrophosphohydrolase/phosphoribosyl-AMP cyclohydrolase|nr:bifunctional phosphoribosyl-AMP cyclohydrolase/phosphoribosyl-ATP diphosphatase HisIE [Lachnospiraceae bacterium]
MGKQIYADLNAVGEREENLKSLIADYQDQGADGYYIYDFSKEEAVRERFIGLVRKVKTEDMPFAVGVFAERFEDVKKALYTGAERVYLRADGKEEVLKEALARFGAKKVGLELDYSNGECSKELLLRLKGLGLEQILLKHVELSAVLAKRLREHIFSVRIRDSLLRNDLTDLLGLEGVDGVATNFYQGKDIRKVKRALREQGICVHIPESRLPFGEFRPGADGLVPVVVQDYRTNEVLMLAYMNEEAYNKTIETGKMTYYSRSRQELWCKGATSGHYQYLKELAIDCDRDTILAKVRQIGAACHTGNRSCFYTNLAAEADSQSVRTASGQMLPEEDGLRETSSADSDSPLSKLSVLEEVYQTIADRKQHPKEGSYTNYLFEKGIDKILKKCGEESAEIIIAAKNPDAVELKYEIADYLYHLMVLMAETGLSWKEIMEELANRH